MPGDSTKSAMLCVRIHSHDMQRMDEARGSRPRSVWVRALIHNALIEAAEELREDPALSVLRDAGRRVKP